MNQDWINGLFGGAIIGVAVSVMLLINGRVTGISGIINGSMFSAKTDRAWRLQFLFGLLAGGILLQFTKPIVFLDQIAAGIWTTAIAGFLVGFGTLLGSGCTSGHGVCGISRLSPRSIIATCTFIAAGVLTVTLLRKLGASL